MASDTRPNYFLLLGLDPDQPWNEARYHSQLRAKRNEWSRQRTRGIKTSTASVEARRGLELVPDIVRVMGDAAERERERKAARAHRAGEEAARRVEFERTLEIILGKGFLYDVEEADLRRQYGDLMNSPDMVQRLARVQRRPFDAAQVVPDRLEPSTASTIRGLLEEVGTESL